MAVPQAISHLTQLPEVHRPLDSKGGQSRDVLNALGRDRRFSGVLLICPTQ